MSARKLVLETAKFNVLTAHSFQEGTECFDTFPKGSAAVIATQDRAACQQLVRYVKDRILFAGDCSVAGHQLRMPGSESSFVEPRAGKGARIDARAAR